ncbi:MAG: aminoglycoside 3'-phosphotransferase [Solirubrobacteraceae bacterium]
MDPPPAVLEVAAGRRIEAVWVNEAGGVTFRLGEGRDLEFMKWTPRTSGLDLHAEAARLRWAAGFVTVPQVLGSGEDPTSSWLLTSVIDGENAVGERWRRDPALAVAAIGRGLRHLHDSLPVHGCPFSWTAESRLARAAGLHGHGVLDPAAWHELHRDLTVELALQTLADPPPVDKLVVCHGDACAPNTLLTSEGDVAGHVDLGALGVGDRWADLAVAAWSTEWNYGPGWENHLLDAYGIDPDPERTAYYRLLWDVSS